MTNTTSSARPWAVIDLERRQVVATRRTQADASRKAHKLNRAEGFTGRYVVDRLAVAVAWPNALPTRASA